MKNLMSRSAAVSVVTLLSPGVSIAQESDPQVNSGLDEIIVTAQRREQSIQDVPIAITAFTPETLQTKLITEPIDVIDYVPNLYGGNNTGLGSAVLYYIRGLGNTESIATFDPPVGTYLDEVYIARQNANNIAFFDVAGVEVLRGPQGTLFGRNTTGGAVNVRMARPSSEMGGFVEAAFGSFDHKLVRGSVDLPLSTNVLSKLSAYWLDEDGFVDNLTTGETLNGREGFGIRGDLRFQSNDALVWDLSASYAEDENANLLNYDAGASPLGSSVPGGLTSDGSDRVARTGLSQRNRESGDQLSKLLAGEGLGVSNETLTLSSNLGYELNDNSQINFIIGYQELNQDFVLDFFDGGLGGEGFATGGFAIANSGQHDQLSAEIKYTASYLNDTLNLVSGLFYFEEDNVTDLADVFTINFGTPAAPVPFPLLLGDRIIENDLTSYAAYSQIDWNFAEDFTLTAGARWTQETKTIDYNDQRDPATIAGPALTTANIESAGIATRVRKALITPRLALQWDPSEDLGLFVSYTEGFKSGGWNARENNPASVLPFFEEQASTFEAGIRAEFADQLRVAATAFLLDVDDLQSPSAFVRNDGSIAFLTQNFSDLENQGLEIEATWQPPALSNLTLDAGLGLQDATYKNPGPDIVAQQATCSASPTNQDGGLGIVAPDCSLSLPVRAPDVTFNLGGQYDFALSNSLTLTPAANLRVVSETFTGTSNLPNSFEDGYTLLNLRLALKHEDGWLAAIECQNCTDTAYVVSNLPPTAYVNEPRRITFRVRRDF
ncbi:MAG: TonB-dependent receptor [Pseudomonadota bacterium]